MRHFYISSINGSSGISKYSRDFYELVLKSRGYEFIDSSESISTILSAVSSRDHAHLEIGIFQQKETELLFLMLKANYRNVSVTLHDAPLLRYPFFQFKNPLLNNISKVVEIYGNSFGAAKPFVEKIKAIYVLSLKGLEAVKKKYKFENVYYLPHIINPSEIQKSNSQNNNLIYFGFVGKNKGVDYSLMLHEQLLKYYPDTHFYLVGKAIGKESRYYSRLKERYKRNVHFLGYIHDEKLNAVFDQAAYAVLPFRKYKFFWPFSGSVLYSLKKGKIVFTTRVNTVHEIIENGKTGFFLSGNIDEDIATLRNAFENNPLKDQISENVYSYLVKNHLPAAVNKQFKD